MSPGSGSPHGDRIETELLLGPLGGMCVYRGERGDSSGLPTDQGAGEGDQGCGQPGAKSSREFRAPHLGELDLRLSPASAKSTPLSPTRDQNSTPGFSSRM